MKTKNFFRMATVVAMCTIFMMTSCGSSKKVVSQGYAVEQNKPTTVAQKQSANRGLKLQKEECEEMALEQVNSLREAGNGVSDKESFAVNLALLDARSKLAQQLEVLVNGLIRNFNQQHEADKDFSSVGKATQIQQGYFEQFLTNTRPICKNTYVKEDGKYNVYVCVEMNSEQQSAMYKALSKDKKVSIDFEENQFLKELEKAKEDYRKQQAE